VDDNNKPCNGGNQCVRGFCTHGGCQGAPALPGTPCDDGTPCTSGDTCQSGRCTGAQVCDDHDACTIDRCDPANGICLDRAPQDINCPQDAIDLSVSFSSPPGRGSGTLSWNTTHEYTLAGFHIVVLNQKGQPVRLNPALIPCSECITGAGAHYEFFVPKHRSAKSTFVQSIGRDGAVLGTFGPAEKAP